MAQSTWEYRELAILEAVAQTDIDGPSAMSYGELREVLDISERDLFLGIRALYEGGYIQADFHPNGPTEIYGIELRERGRRAVGQWPSDDDAYGNLLQLLEERAAAEPDPDRKSRFLRVINVLEDVGANTVGGVLATLIQRAGGM